MAVSLTLTGKSPIQTQFGLDTFTEHYKCDVTADVVLTDPDVPQIGSAHDDYPFMFVTGRPCQETGESASALDLVYTGCMTDDGDGNPILPAQQHESSTAVQSATSLRSNTGVILASPITIQFFAPSTKLSYISFGSGGGSAAADPTPDLVIITISCGDTTFTGSSTSALIAGFFVEQIIETPNSSEIVVGQFWQNTSTKVKNLMPFAFTLNPGPQLIMVSPGTGYSISDSLTISSGGESAVITVTLLGVSNSIASFTTVSDTFTVAHTSLSASGGSGSGAAFDVILIP